MRHHQSQALFKNLIIGLIDHGRIRTTKAKAKSVQGLIDKLVTQAKKNTIHARRLLDSFLHNQTIVNQLVDDIAPRLKDRVSGYTRITKLGNRRGDNSPMVNLEFIDLGESTPKPKAVKKISTKKKTTSIKKTTPFKVRPTIKPTLTKTTSTTHRTQSKG